MLHLVDRGAGTVWQIKTQGGLYMSMECGGRADKS